MRHYFFLFYLLLLPANNSFASEELKIITPHQYQLNNPSPERAAIINFIIHQIDYKRKSGVSQAELDLVWNDLDTRNKLRLIRFQIIGQKLYADGFEITDSFFIAYSNYLQKILATYRIKDVDFMIHCLEGLPPETKIDIPSFMVTKDSQSFAEKDRLLLPDVTMIRDEWKQLADKIIKAKPNYPWTLKVNKIFWRGSTTGGGAAVYNLENFAQLPRLKIVMLSALYPDLIDAQFTRYPKFYFEEQSKLQEILNLVALEKVTKIKEEDHLNYKYLISIDGNSSAWQRLPWIMLSNSVLLKQETSEVQWFYAALKPYINYIPVDEHLFHLFAQLEWMQKHDLELESITENAQNFILHNLMPEHVEIHTSLILNEYHQLHHGKQLTPSLPFAEESLAKIESVRQSKLTKVEKVNEFFVKLEEKLNNLFGH